MTAYETNKVREMSFSNVSPAALDVICASVIAVGLLPAGKTTKSASASPQPTDNRGKKKEKTKRKGGTHPISKQATTTKTGSSAILVVIAAYHPNSGSTTIGTMTILVTTATKTVRVSPGRFVLGAGLRRRALVTKGLSRVRKGSDEGERVAEEEGGEGR